jgi:hypothetical protein
VYDFLSENISVVGPETAIQGVSTIAQAIADSDAWIAARRITDAQKAINTAGVLSGYPNTECATYRAEYIESVTRQTCASSEIAAGWSASFHGFVALRGAWDIPNPFDYQAGTGLDVRWAKSGNIIRLVWGGLTIREYDVTGLT